MSKRDNGEPFPVRLYEPESGDVVTLKNRHGLPKSEVIRRCLFFALPKFLSGEADISRVVAQDKPSGSTPGGK